MGFYAQRIFPWLLDATEPKGFVALRKAALAGVQGDTLEVGFGTGANLPFYPRTLHALTVIEPSGGMRRRAARHIAKWDGVLTIAPFDGDRWPFEDQQFDTVVISLVLCSANDPDSVLSEVRRVLKPGGKYHFLEHVKSTEPQVQRRQAKLNNLHKKLACGCNLTRDTIARIKHARFEIETLTGPETMPGFGKSIYPYVYGIARVKP